MTSINYYLKGNFQTMFVQVFACNIFMTCVQGKDINTFTNDSIQTNSYPMLNPIFDYINTENTELVSLTETTIKSGAFPLYQNSMQASEYQIAYCVRLCRGNNLIYIPQTELCPAIECFPCDCNKPVCKFYGTCCPDYRTSLPINISNYKNLDDPIKFTNPLRAEDFYSSDTIMHQAANNSDIKFICDITKNLNYLVIKSCPADYVFNRPERARCEEDVPISEMDLETFLPVTDMITGRSYFNRYCAICNGVTNVVNWNVTELCWSYMEVYQANTPDEFLRLSLAPESDCDVIKEPPDFTRVQTCRRSWFGSVVSSCNVTGQWDVYDDDVVRACEDVSGIASRTRFNNTVYKNIFCALCNMNGSDNVMVICPTDSNNQEGDDIPLPFSFLLNLNSPFTSDIEKCPDNSIRVVPKISCLPLTCSPGKIFINGTCATANKEVKELSYKVQLLYILDNAVDIPLTQYSAKVSQEYVFMFLDYVSNIIIRTSSVYDIKLSMFQSKVIGNQSSIKYSAIACLGIKETSCNLYLPWMSLNIKLKSSRTFSRDELEILFVDQLIMKNIFLKTDNNDTVIFKPVLPIERKISYTDCTTNNIENVSCIPYSLSQAAHLLGNEFIMIEPQLNCPFISLNSSDYSYKNNSLNSGITLYLSNEPVTISELDDLNLVSIAGDGTLKICQELLEDTITSYLLFTNVIENSSLVLSQYILSWVCLLSSVICLLLTVMTYLLFPVLRSVAGKNNIFLSVSLLLAQSFLLASSHVKQTGYLCTFLAVSTHFLWLSMFCWCFTTCIHMFRVFTAKTIATHTTATSERLQLLKNTVGCSVIPALIIIGVIVTNYFTTEGRLIGYGHDKCFLDSTPLVAITLVTPLCFILLCNIFFFCVTIIKIHNVHKLQTQDFKQDDRVNLYIYVKLSSMTGMFWILNIIAEATDNDPLRFIAIFLNGLQGVFIFLSYICNRRVLKLYAQTLGFEKLNLFTSTSDKSTIAKELSRMGK